MPKKTAARKPKGTSATKKTVARKAAPKSKASPPTSQKNTVRKPATKKKASVRSPRRQPPSFEREINSFVTNVESLSKALTPTMEAMVESFKKSGATIDAFIKKKRGNIGDVGAESA